MPDGLMAEDCTVINGHLAEIRYRVTRLEEDMKWVKWLTRILVALAVVKLFV